MTDESFDIIIVGAGPAGLSAGIYTARANIPTLILGNLYDSQLAKSGFVENYPGFPEEGIDGIRIAEKMKEQAEKWGCSFDDGMVVDLKREETGTILVSTRENEYRGTAVILAIGASPIKLNIPGEKELEHRGVSYCTVCDGSLFRGKEVAIVGRGTGLGKGSVYMIPLARHIGVINTDPVLITEQTYIQRMERARNINIVHSAEPVKITGEGRVESFSYKDKEGQLATIDVAAVFIEAGTSPNYELAQRFGLELTKNNYIRVKRMTQETSIPGVFAAGDITGGRRQIAVAVGEGSSAGISAIRYVGTQK